MLKLCVSDGYAYVFNVYTGEEVRADGISVAEKVVTDLMDGLVDGGNQLVYKCFTSKGTDK